MSGEGIDGEQLGVKGYDLQCLGADTACRAKECDASNSVSSASALERGVNLQV